MGCRQSKLLIVPSNSRHASVKRVNQVSDRNSEVSLWEMYFDDSEERKSIIDTSRQDPEYDSSVLISNKHVISNSFVSTTASNSFADNDTGSQRSTLVLNTKDSLVLIRSVQVLNVDDMDLTDDEIFSLMTIIDDDNSNDAQPSLTSNYLDKDKIKIDIIRKVLVGDGKTEFTEESDDNSNYLPPTKYPSSSSIRREIEVETPSEPKLRSTDIKQATTLSKTIADTMNLVQNMKYIAVNKKPAKQQRPVSVAYSNSVIDLSSGPSEKSGVISNEPPLASIVVSPVHAVPSVSVAPSPRIAQETSPRQSITSPTAPDQHRRISPADLILHHNPLNSTGAKRRNSGSGKFQEDSPLLLLTGSKKEKVTEALSSSDKRATSDKRLANTDKRFGSSENHRSMSDRRLLGTSNKRPSNEGPYTPSSSTSSSTSTSTSTSPTPSQAITPLASISPAAIPPTVSTSSPSPPAPSQPSPHVAVAPSPTSAPTSAAQQNKSSSFALSPPPTSSSSSSSSSSATLPNVASSSSSTAASAQSKTPKSVAKPSNTDTLVTPMKTPVSMSLQTPVPQLTPSLSVNLSGMQTPSSAAAALSRGNSMWLKMNCPGKKVPIRNSASVKAEVIGYISSGTKIHVNTRSVAGFYQLVDQPGFLNKATNGVEWVPLAGPDNV